MRLLEPGSVTSQLLGRIRHHVPHLMICALVSELGSWEQERLQVQTD